MAIITITKDNFESEIGSYAGDVLVDFWATWCGPCRMMSPIIDQIAEEYPQLKVGKIDTDAQPELAARFEIFSIPTLMHFRDGQLVNSAVGVQPKAAVLQMVGLE